MNKWCPAAVRQAVVMCAASLQHPQPCVCNSLCLHPEVFSRLMRLECPVSHSSGALVAAPASIREKMWGSPFLVRPP